MPYLYLLLVFMFSSGTQATIYKTVDQDGNVVYTDVKPRNTQGNEVELPELTPIESVPAPSYSPNRKKLESRKVVPDLELKIIEPAHDATIRNSGNFSVSLSVFPKLPRSYQVRLYLDDELIESKRSLVFSLENIVRGTHRIKVEVINAKGGIVASAENTVHVHRAIAKP